jgi:hypothetical protein
VKVQESKAAEVTEEEDEFDEYVSADCTTNEVKPNSSTSVLAQMTPSQPTIISDLLDFYQ